MDLQLYGGKSKKSKKSNNKKSNNKKSNHKKKIHIPTHNPNKPGMDLVAKQINEIIGDDVGKNNIILNKQIFNRSMNNLKAYNGSMDTALQPKQQTLDPRIMNNLFTATELFVNAIVSIIHAIEELIEDEEPFINRLNWKVLFDDFSKFKVVMTTWITSNTQRNVPTIVVEIDKIISYFNQLLVIIQTYERMPTRPELSKLNKTMVNNMTNYLSSISGSVNKLVDFNIDNVNDGFIDPENNGFGGDDDDDDDDDDGAQSPVGTFDFANDSGDENDLLDSAFEFHTPASQQQASDISDIDYHNLFGSPTTSGRQMYQSILGVQPLMAIYHLNREQAAKAEKIINEGPNPFTDPSMVKTLKDYYKTNSNYMAELHWMVERGIIDENDFNRIVAKNDADIDSGIDGPQFDQGTMISPLPLSPSRSRLITPQEFHNIVQYQIQQLQVDGEVDPEVLHMWTIIQQNWDRYSDNERQSFIRSYDDAVDAQSRYNLQNQQYDDEDNIQSARQQDDMKEATQTKQKGQPKINYNRVLTPVEKNKINSTVSNQFKKYQKEDYKLLPSYENIMNYSQNKSLTPLVSERMDMINNAYFSQKYR